jgi:hypothetical protein
MTAFDFLAFVHPGMVLKTRDRRDARILAVMDGLIHGEVQMMGPCAWCADGRYRDAPAGAAGPWDLMPPRSDGAVGGQSHESLSRALQRGDGGPGCCD